jgi:hypothetical protein
VKAHFETNNLSYYTFYPKSQKPVKAVICHLLQNTPAEDIQDGLLDLGFDVMSIAHWSAEGTTSITLPLLLEPLPRTAKSQDIFKFFNLCHISIKVQTYKSQKALKQCYNCQKFHHSG